MKGLKLFAICDKAARNYSKTASLDVLVVCESGSKFLYLDGEEREIPWFGSAMPLHSQGQKVPELELSPVGVQSGHWSDEAENFIASRTMTVEEFLTLANSN
jgi:hypothetical protein